MILRVLLIRIAGSLLFCTQLHGYSNLLLAGNHHIAQTSKRSFTGDRYKSKHEIFQLNAVQGSQSAWSKTICPCDYFQVESSAVTSLNKVLADGNDLDRLLSIEVLTPGLNPKLEQKAIMMQEYIFGLAASLIPILKIRFSNTVMMFQSTGDAASFLKFCRNPKYNVDMPESVSISGIDFKKMSPDVQCVLYVQLKNNLGDPVISEIEKIYESFSGATNLLLNCDLSERVATSLRERTKRDEFRSKIKPVFYFRNIVSISRPSMVPIEEGAVIFQPSKGWEVFAINDDDIVGPGSLNRFVKQAVFKREVDDPTAANPPRFISAGVYQTSPGRDDFEAILSKAKYTAAKSNSQPSAVTTTLPSVRDVNRVVFSSVFDAREYIQSNMLNNDLYNLAHAIGYITNNSISLSSSVIVNEDTKEDRQPPKRMGFLDFTLEDEESTEVSPELIIRSKSAIYQRGPLSTIIALKSNLWRLVLILNVAKDGTENNPSLMQSQPNPFFSKKLWKFSAEATSEGQKGDTGDITSVTIDTFLGPFRTSSSKTSVSLANDILFVQSNVSGSSLTGELFEVLSYYPGERFLILAEQSTRIDKAMLIFESEK